MNIKKLVPVVILVVIGGGAAFVYFDPLDLDLLGWKKGSAVVRRVAPPHVAAPAAQPPVAAPKAASAPAQANAPVAAASAVPSRTAAPVTPRPAATPVVAAPVATSAVATSSVATPAKALSSPLKLSKSIKAAQAKPERSKSADLRHCLDLETNAAIAKCAGE